MKAIIKKELRTYSNSITGYVFVGFLVLICGIFFSFTNIFGGSLEFGSVLYSITFLFSFIIPIITMRLISEEMRQKTDQLLLTSPTTVTNIVIGKYFAAILLLLCAVVITCVFPVIMSFYAQGHMPVAKTIGSYIGFYLVGCSLIAIGLFISSLTENQVVAAVITLATFIILMLFSSIATALPTQRVPSVVFMFIVAIVCALLIFYIMRNVYISVLTFLVLGIAIVVALMISHTVFDGVMTKTVNWLSIMNRFENFGMGILNIGDIVYYISLSTAFVYLTVMNVEKRRWS